MAKKIDDELIKDTRTENRGYKQKNSTDTTETKQTQTTNTQTPPPAPEKTETLNNGSGAASNAEKIEALNEAPETNEFKEKFDEYFKGVGKMIAGETVVNIVDDLKTNFLWIYAKKSGVDVPKEALKMDDKSKQFAAFLVDHAMKNKLFTVIEKYPLISALGVVGISGVSSYLMISMLKKGKEEEEKLIKENADMRATIERLEKERQEFVIKSTQTPENIMDMGQAN